MVTADLLSRARAGDGEAFRELTGPHRRELQVHCYRMPGSFAGAGDAVQETMPAAWQGTGGFTRERASLRTWLCKIATSRCLSARRAASRRPARERDVSRSGLPVPAPRDEAAWPQPFPDALLEGAAGVPPGPEARYEQTEAISLAFVTALQVLPPRQVAVLILRDVPGFHASEVAGLLQVTIGSVSSALKRARASLDQRRPPAANRLPPPAHPPRMRSRPASPAHGRRPRLDALVAGLRAVKVSSRENTPWRISHRGPAECGRPGMKAGTSTGPAFDPADSTRAPGRFWPEPALRHAPEWTAA